MFRLLLFSYLFSFLALSNFTAVTENDPSTLVDGVSVITGDFYTVEEDYLVAGAEPIPVHRIYLSSIGGLIPHPHLTATFCLFDDQLLVNEPNGTSVSYNPDPQNKPRKTIGEEFYGNGNLPLKYLATEFANSSLGVSNTSTGTMSAKSQIKNQTIVFDPRKDAKGKSFSLYVSDGTVRRYINHEHQKKSDFGPYGEAYTVYLYKFVSETLPNGHVIHYQWDHKNRAICTWTSNPQGTKTFAKLPLQTFDPKNPLLSYALSGSDGRSLHWESHKKNEKLTWLAKVISPENISKKKYNMVFHHR